MKFWRIAAWTVLLSLITATLPADHIEPADGEAPPTVALVLSGGGALGFAHIGALKVIDRVGLPIDYVIGTSMGGLVGGLYAIGYTPEEIDAVAEGTDWMRIFTAPDSPYTYYFGPVIEQEENIISLSFDGQGLGRSLGLIPDQRILTLLSELTAKVSHIRDFDQFHIPFRAVAVDLIERSTRVFSSGLLTDALRSTMAVPGVFAPYEVDGGYYVDGGILNSLPTDVAEDLGADIIIAVNVDWQQLETIRDVKSPVDVLLRVTELVISANEKPHVEKADIYIHPDLGDLTLTQFSRYRDLISRGEEAALKAMPQLLELKKELSGVRDMPVYNAERVGHYLRLETKIISDIRTSELDFSFPLEMFQEFRGRMVTPAFHSQLQRVINQIATNGRYESISYALHDNGDGSYDLELKPVVLERGKHSFGLGFSYSGAITFAEPDRFVHSAPMLTSSLVLTELFETNAYAAINLRLGSETHFTADMFVPFGGMVYLHPQLTLFSGEFRDEYGTNRSTQLAFSQEVGFLTGHFSEIGAAAEANLHWLDPSDNNPLSFQSDFELLVGPSLTWKNTEKKRFLHEGVVCSGELLLPLIDRQSWYGKLLLSFEHYMPLNYNSTISYSLKAGSYRGSITSLHSSFDIGGWDGIPGYIPRTRVKDDMAMAGFSYQQRFGEISSVLGFDLYGIGVFRAGRGWDNVFDELTFRPDFGGGIGLGLGTGFGDIIIGAGINDKGQIAYYIMMN